MGPVRTISVATTAARGRGRSPPTRRQRQLQTFEQADDDDQDGQCVHAVFRLPVAAGRSNRKSRNSSSVGMVLITAGASCWCQPPSPRSWSAKPGYRDPVLRFGIVEWLEAYGVEKSRNANGWMDHSGKERLQAITALEAVGTLTKVLGPLSTHAPNLFAPFTNCGRFIPDRIPQGCLLWTTEATFQRCGLFITSIREHHYICAQLALHEHYTSALHRRNGHGGQESEKS